MDAIQSQATNPKDLVGQTKPNIHLVPPVAIIHEARAFEDGARKYGPYNWRDNAVLASVYTSACLRHIYQYMDGEDYDPGSGCHHLAHARACLAILLDGPVKDDRPTKGMAAEALRSLAQPKK